MNFPPKNLISPSIGTFRLHPCRNILKISLLRSFLGHEILNRFSQLAEIKIFSSKENNKIQKKSNKIQKENNFFGDFFVRSRN